MSFASYVVATLLGIMIWRAFSDLQEVDYNGIRKIIKEEISKKES